MLRHRTEIVVWSQLDMGEVAHHMLRHSADTAWSDLYGHKKTFLFFFNKSTYKKKNEEEEAAAIYSDEDKLKLNFIQQTLNSYLYVHILKKYVFKRRLIVEYKVCEKWVSRYN